MNDILPSNQAKGFWLL